MDINLEFPLYAIWAEDDYYSPEGTDEDDLPALRAMMFTTKRGAEDYIRGQKIDASIMRFVNSYRFRRFLVGLNDPTPEIVCDATRDEQGNYKVGWRAEVEFLVNNVLPPLGFAWDYPLNFVFNERGIASIQGTTQDGESVTLVALFTDQDLAERYMRKADVPGDIGAIEDETGFLEFVNDISAQGIIIDPASADTGSIGQMCVAKSKLIEHLTPDQLV